MLSIIQIPFSIHSLYIVLVISFDYNMSRAALMAFATNPSPTLKHKCKFIDIIRTTVVSCPSFYTLKESTIAYKETVRHKKTMEVSELKLRGWINNGSVLFHQISNELHTALNRLVSIICSLKYISNIMIEFLWFY